MEKLTLAHIEKLVELEKQVRYDDFPPVGQLPFEVINYDSPVLLSAPHGAITFRNDGKQIWHEEDEYTAGMALLLSEICNTPAIVMKAKCGEYDPNYTEREDIPYKREIQRLIEERGIRFVIDLHGAAMYSPTLDADQTIDLGIRQKSPADTSSIGLEHVEQLELLFSTMEPGCKSSDFVVRRNRFSASNPGTITTFASKHKSINSDMNVQAIQIEMKPQLRVVKRLPSATLYKSCGPFEANPLSVLHTLQSLVNFVAYLKNQIY
ncbi:MAG: hypothetical protein DPW18_01585 [Chloroflexi bacterium]|nr:hypothetical protein [Chloroflexota bacterium]MDL1943707.1 N-formylglutamate amidohydrolase [Chloroflexi bacterium CFX2]